MTRIRMVLMLSVEGLVEVYEDMVKALLVLEMTIPFFAKKWRLQYNHCSRWNLDSSVKRN